MKPSLRPFLLFGLLATAPWAVHGQPQETPSSQVDLSNEFRCSQPSAERDAFIAQAEEGKFTTRRVEFSGNRYTRDPVLRRKIVIGLREGNVFTRANLERSLRSVSTLNVINPVRSSDTVVYLDASTKLVDMVICITEKRQPPPDLGAAMDAQIREIIKKYDEAWNKKEVAAVESLLDPGYVYFTSKGQVSTRQNTIEMLRSPNYVLKSAMRSEVTLHRTGNTAVVGSRWRGHGTFNGTEFRDNQRCSLVLTLTKGKWIIVSEHCTQIPTQEPERQPASP